MRRCLALPAFKLVPPRSAGRSIRAQLMDLLSLVLDLLLLPVNLVVGIRNILPGRWRYRWVSGKFWRDFAEHLGRGEATLPPIGFVRQLVGFMITIHAYNRLRLVSQRIYLDDTLSEDARQELEKRACEIRDHWKRPSVAQIVYSYVLPFSAPIVAVFKLMFGSQGRPEFLPAEIAIVIYAVTIAVSAFICKRALMLGGAGPLAYYPALLAGAGGYAEEAGLLGRVGIRIKEFPFDMACFWLNVVALCLLYSAEGRALYLPHVMAKYGIYFVMVSLVPIGLFTGYKRLVGERR